jgi:hypothetical protein
MLMSLHRFAGVVARKYLFLTIYAYFIYVHFFINVAIATYFLWMVVHGANRAIVKACQGAVKDMGGQDQCEGLLKITKQVYVAVASLVLLVEMCASIAFSCLQGRFSRLLLRWSHPCDPLHAETT